MQKIITATVFLGVLTLYHSEAMAQSADCKVVPNNERVEAMNTVGPDEQTFGGFFGASPTPYCRVYSADLKTVNVAIAKVLPRLGYPVKTMDVNNGFFVTDEMERSSILAHWKDSFNITVQQEKPNEVVVRVLRNVQTLEKKRWHLTASKGNNEKYILTQLSDALASGSAPSASSPASPGGDAQADTETKLKKLQELREKKLISEEEYAAMRKKALEESLK